MLKKRARSSKSSRKQLHDAHPHLHVKESHSRIFLKSVSYTGLVVIADACIIQFITQKAEQTLEVLIITNLASLGIYYIHAHIWNRVRHGHRLAK